MPERTFTGKIVMQLAHIQVLCGYYHERVRWLLLGEAFIQVWIMADDFLIRVPSRIQQCRFKCALLK